MKKVLKTLLVDDEEGAVGILTNLLQGNTEIDIVGAAATIDDAVRFVSDHRPDLLFLDIQMEKESGFDLLPRLDYSPQVIFVTSHARHAVRAFEVNAVDYLVKPVNAQRLELALSRLRRRTDGGDVGALGAEDVIIQRETGRLHVIPVAKIGAITAEGNFTRVYLRGAECLYLCRMIGEWEAMLPADTFVRADRTLLFNVAQVREITSLSRNTSLVCVDGVEEKFELGRTGSTRLREALRKLRY